MNAKVRYTTIATPNNCQTPMAFIAKESRFELFCWHALAQRRPSIGLFAVLAFASANGCSDRPELVPVSGIVMIDGEPLTSGNIKFVPDGARASWGVVENGAFELSCYAQNDGAVPGTHRVQISALEVLSPSKSKWLAPRKYADFRTSGLTVDVTEPTEDVKIELTWEGSPPGKPFVE